MSKNDNIFVMDLVELCYPKYFQQCSNSEKSLILFKVVLCFYFVACH